MIDNRTALLFSTLAGSAVALAVLTIWQLLDNRGRGRIHEVNNYASQIAEQLIRKDLSTRLATLNRIARRWTVANGTPRAEWEADATRHVADMPGFQAIEWADASLRIRWVSPMRGNEAAQDLDISKVPRAKAAVDRARARGKATLSLPFELAQGGKGLAAYAPVTQSEIFDGVIVGVFRLDSWLKKLFAHIDYTQHHTRVFFDNAEVYRDEAASNLASPSWTTRREFIVQGLTWSTEVTPTREFVAAVRTGASMLVLLGGLVFSVLVAAVVYMAITARSRASELDETAGQLTALLESLPGMAYRCANDRRWPMEFVSQGCEQLSGYARAELEERRILWADLIHPDDQDRVWKSVHDALSADRAFEVEYRITRRDQEERWVWGRGRGVKSDGDETILLKGFISDITDRKRAESELLEARAFSETVVETAAEAVITIDTNGSIETFNRAAQQMFDYTLNEVRGENVRTLMPDPYRSEHDEYISRYLSTNDPKIIGIGREVSARRKDGTKFPIHLSVSEVDLHDERKFVGLIRDISLQRAAETEAREHREQLAHVDRLNMLGEMASGMAHEINQPLTAISLFSQAGKRLLDTGKEDRLPEIFDKLSQHAQRAGEIIERMQAMARRGESARETAECNALVEEVAKLAEAEARIRDITIEFSPTSDLPLVSVDAVQIQQVALNLLRNGMEAMRSIDCENGSIITLKTALRDDGDVAVLVVDSGCGVSEELTGKIFTPFSTTKESGMGMGLSLSRAIITAHGGELAFYNNDSGGATFYFTLPSIR